MKLLRLLRENWRWWAIPMIAVAALTLLLAYSQRGEVARKIDYGLGPNGP